jgi:plastocyanin
MGDPVTQPVRPGDDGNNGGAEHSRFVVSMKDNVFLPESLTVVQGDTVEWLNEGFLVHTTTSGSECGPDGDGVWNSGDISPADSFDFVFDDVGEFPYYCIPHCLLGMTGHVQVVPQN